MKANTMFAFAKNNIKDQITRIHGLTLYPGQEPILQRIWLGARELIIMHREFGKSTMAEEVALNDTIYEKGSFVLYISATLEAAIDHTRAIKAFFEMDELPNGLKNPLVALQPDKGNSKSYKWSDADFVTRHGNRVKALGFDKFMLGKREKDIRPTRIIVDDPVRKEPGHDEATVDTFYKTILPMGSPMTRFCVVGTPRRYEDLIMTLNEDDDSVWHKVFYPAIQPDGTISSPKYWMRRGACCYDNKFPCGPLEGMDLVREHIAMKKREVKSAAWASEFLLQPRDESNSLFPMDMLKCDIVQDRNWGFGHSRRRAAHYNNLIYERGEHHEMPRCVIGCDFAYGRGKEADYNVYTVLECVQSQPFRIIDILRKQGMSFAEQKQELVSLNAIYRPQLVYAESNMAQVVFSDDIIEYQKQIPLVKFYHGGNKNKIDVGIPSLKTYFENGSIRVPYGDKLSRAYSRVLFEELNGILHIKGKIKSTTKHDDCVDSLWIALMAAKNITENSLQVVGGFSMNDLNKYDYDEEEDESSQFSLRSLFL